MCLILGNSCRGVFTQNMLLKKQKILQKCSKDPNTSLSYEDVVNYQVHLLPNKLSP